MNCVEAQEVLPEIIDGSPNNEFQSHLKSCPVCSELVSDLQSRSEPAPAPEHQPPSEDLKALLAEVSSLEAKCAQLEAHLGEARAAARSATFLR